MNQQIRNIQALPQIPLIPKPSLSFSGNIQHYHPCCFTPLLKILMQDNITATMIEVHENAAMVSPNGGDPFQKTAYFLKPIVPSSTDEPPPEISQCFTFIPSDFEPKKLELEFRGRYLYHSDLKTWAEQLASKYQGIWKRAGVYDAIYSSMCEIRKKKDLVLGLGEKWCCETNTFVFGWGEATVTLEDVMILGGFSVLGDSVFSSLGTREMREVEDRLEVMRLGVQRRTGAKSWRIAYTDLWMKEFMNSGSELEHEAFLVFWLSRYVFHDARDSVNKAVFSIAIRLARGIRVALAPAVLANIYRDLSLLKRSIVGSELKVMIKSPFHLLQVWAWERLLELRPRPNGIRNAEPRLTRWDKVYGLNVKNLRRVLDSAGEGFLWRPYGMAVDNWEVPNYYPIEEKWVMVGPSMKDDELLSFSICLRVKELVGFGTNQQYLPHRVAMQFGYDQDIPALVAAFNHNTNKTWKKDLEELENVMLYLPSRLSEGDASTRYLQWWKESMAHQKHRSMPLEKKAASRPCIHSPKNAEELVEFSVGGNVHRGNDSLVPPGFPPKRNRPEVADRMDDDDLTISEALKVRKKHKTVETRKGSNVQNFSPDHDKILAFSIADEYSVNTITSERYEKGIAPGKVLTWGGNKGKREPKKMRSLYKIDMSKAAALTDDMVNIFGNDGPRRSSPVEEQERPSHSSFVEEPECAFSSSSFDKKVLELGSRVTKLEKIFEILKSSTLDETN